MSEPAPNTPAPTVVITMINYRTAEMTIDCAKSLLEHAGDVDFRLVLIDNNSGDGSADKMASWISSLPAGHPVSLVRSAANTGFAGGHNLGIQSIPGAAFYMPLNSDAMVLAGALPRMLAAMEADPGLGLLGPALLNGEDEIEASAFRHHSPISELMRAATSGPIDKVLARWRVALPVPPSPEEIEWVSFACVMIRAEVIDAIGLLDDGYFMYFEDADYCLRATKAGWRVGYLPEAQIVHYRGGSAPVKKLAKAHRRLPRYYYASRSRALYRSHGHIGLFAANLLWHLGRVLARARALVGRSVPKANEHEARDIWINFLTPTGDRYAPDN